MRSPATTAVIALAAGLVAGTLAARTDPSSSVRAVAAAIEPIGTLWVNAIRMTVVPLVVSLLVASIASAGDVRAVGRLAGRAIAIFVSLLSVLAVGTALVAPIIFAQVSIDPAAAAELRRTVVPDAAAVQVPGFSSWLVSLVPTNPIRAASDGAMLPLIVFTAAFALALTRVREEMRTVVVDTFRGIADAMLVLVQWILLLAPIGVFALAVTLALRLGTDVAAVVAVYLLTHSGLLVIATAFVYVVVAVVGRADIGRFARAVLPAQVVGIGTRSSMAALPAMLTGAERVMRLPERVSAFGLPFGVSVFRLNASVTWVVMALFVSKLYGIPLGAREIAILSAACVAFSFSVPGIPSGSLFVVAPFFVAVGLPVEGIGLLIALDAIPDIFKTTLNVTAHMGAATILSRWSGEEADPVDAAAVGSTAPG